MDGFQVIADAIREAEKKASSAGVPASAAMAILLRAEAELVQALVSSRREARQFLLQLREQGATQLASDRGCSRATIYNRRQDALNKLSKFGVAKLDAA